MSDLGYLFSSEPRPVLTIPIKAQPKYRDVSSNIMYDKRVVRGPTFRAKPEQQAALIVTKLAAPIKTKTGNSGSSKTSKFSHSTQLTSVASFAQNSLSAPSISVQTDDYLEDLASEIFECDGFSQTDAITDEWNSEKVLALFTPAVRGIDAATCIEGAELFEFEVEVEPILQVLVGKTLDQSMIEVNEEEELAFLERQREKFANERALVIAESQRLEAEHDRRLKEKARRFEQERQRLIQQQQTNFKRDAALAAQAAMIELQRRTEAAIKAQWRDPVKAEVEEKFIPWLKAEIEARILQQRQHESAIDQLIHLSINSIAEQVEQHEAKLEAERIEHQRLEQEAAEAARLAEEERLQLIAEMAARAAEEEEKRLKAEADAANAEENDDENEEEEDED